MIDKYGGLIMREIKIVKRLAATLISFCMMIPSFTFTSVNAVSKVNKGINQIDYLNQVKLLILKKITFMQLEFIILTKMGINTIYLTMMDFNIMCTLNIIM